MGVIIDWKSGQPNNWSNQDCIEITNGEWSDEDCVTDTKKVMCEGPADLLDGKTRFFVLPLAEYFPITMIRVMTDELMPGTTAILVVSCFCCCLCCDLVF